MTHLVETMHIGMPTGVRGYSLCIRMVKASDQSVQESSIIMECDYIDSSFEPQHI